METHRKHILVADDDYDNFLLTMDAAKEAGLECDLHWVKDGEELMDYLLRRGAYRVSNSSPVPSFILLDLNMPKMNGHEALKEIRSNPGLAGIPIIILTVSTAEEDIVRSYELGANAYISKLQNFDLLVRFMKSLKKYL